MKKYILLMFMLVIMLHGAAFAQEMEGEDHFRMEGTFGATSIDGVVWYNMSFFPELTFGKLGIGLYIRVLYNDEGGIRDEDWDHWTDWAQILYYVRWAHKGEPLYIRLGALSDSSLGHGVIVGHYNNQLDINNRKIGLVFDVNINDGAWGVETMTNDVLRARVMGARGYFRPLNSLPYFFSRFGIGATYATDIDPDEDPDTKNDGAAVFGADVELPLVTMDSFSALAYDDVAKLRPEDDTLRKQFEEDKTDWGNAGGLMGRLLMFNWRVEKRFFKRNFAVPYFDSFYEVERSTKLATLAANTEDLDGWYGELSYGIMGMYVMCAYEDYKGRNPRMRGEARVRGVIPRINLVMVYDKKEIENFPKELGELDRNSILLTEIGYQMAPNFETVITYRQAFDKYGNMTKTSSLHTRFVF
ncbi:MAG: hypothetical protein ABH868_01735 [bacterium]